MDFFQQIYITNLYCATNKKYYLLPCPYSCLITVHSIHQPQPENLYCATNKNYYLLPHPFCSLFLHIPVSQPENLYCATNKKYYLLPHQIGFCGSQIMRSAKSWSSAHARYLRHLRYLSFWTILNSEYFQSKYGIQCTFCTF